MYRRTKDCHQQTRLRHRSLALALRVVAAVRTLVNDRLTTALTDMAPSLPGRFNSAPIMIQASCEIGDLSPGPQFHEIGACNNFRIDETVQLGHVPSKLWFESA